MHHRIHASKEQARRDLFASIEGLYNSHRLHSAPGYLSPAEMERAAAYPVHFLRGEDQAHVRFLRAGTQAFNLAPVDLPALNLAAMGAPTDDATFLALARQLETVGHHCV